MNIKSSLTIKFTAIVAGILFVFSIFTYQFSNVFKSAGFTDLLKSNSKNLSVNFLDNEQLSLEILKLIFEKRLNRFPAERLIIVDKHRGIIFTSDQPTHYELDLLSQLIQDQKENVFHKGDTEVVSFILKHSANSYYVVSSAVDVAGHEKIRYLKIVLIVLFLGSIVVAAVSGWAFSNQALKPIKEVIKQVGNINENSLNERINEGNGRDEIAYLSIVFNKMMDRLENSFIMQKSFVANASHEFRTPLTIMKGQIEVLLLQERNEKEYIRTFISLLEDVENQIQLINSLSQLARANADFPNTSFKKISILDVIIEASEELQKQKTKYKIQLEWGDFPEDEELYYVHGEYTLLKSVFINLMDNACKFSVDKKCQAKVKFGKYFIDIKIQDSGPGIDKSELNLIFEPFYRSNQTRNVAGYGIGLSLVKKTLELHRGSIFVHSELGVGTEVTVQLPNCNQAGKEKLKV